MQIFVWILPFLVSHVKAYNFDYLDDAMKDSMDFWRIRGASIAFFDKVRALTSLG